MISLYSYVFSTSFNMFFNMIFNFSPRMSNSFRQRPLVPSMWPASPHHRWGAQPVAWKESRRQSLGQVVLLSAPTWDVMDVMCVDVHIFMFTCILYCSRSILWCFRDLAETTKPAAFFRHFLIHKSMSSCLQSCLLGRRWASYARQKQGLRWTQHLLTDKVC